MTVFTAPPTGANRKTLATVTFYAAGCAMLLFVAAGPSIVRQFGYGALPPAAAASGLLTILATALAGKVNDRVALVAALVLAAAMRLLLVDQEPFFSTDIYRYVWDGRVQAAGINPYLYIPADPALAALRDAAIYPHINRAGFAVTAYPPLAEMFFLAVTRIAESTLVMRIAMVACEGVIVAVVIALLRRLALPETAVVAYAWHPLAVFEIANSGHVDALMVALMMLGVWLLVRARRVAGAVAIALAVVVKPYAVLVMPAFWRPSLWKQWDWRVPLAFVAAILVCYLPYIGAGKAVFGYLGAGYLSEEGLTSGEGIWLVALVQVLIGKVPGLTAIYVAAAAIIMGWLGLRIAFRGEQTDRQAIADVALLLTAGLFLISPNYAWYFLALVPFIPLGAGAPAWALTLGTFLIYRPLLLPENDLAWKTLATLPFLVTLVFVLTRRRA